MNRKRFVKMLYVGVTEAMHSQLEGMAEERGGTVSGLVREAIEKAYGKAKAVEGRKIGVGKIGRDIDVDLSEKYGISLEDIKGVGAGAEDDVDLDWEDDGEDEDWNE